MGYLKTSLAIAAITALSGCYNEYNRNNDNMLEHGSDYNLETGVKRMTVLTNTGVTSGTTGSAGTAQSNGNAPL